MTFTRRSLLALLPFVPVVASLRPPRKPAGLLAQHLSYFLGPADDGRWLVGVNSR